MMNTAVAVLFVFPLAATAQEKAGKTIWDGVYTADQAKRGEAVFSNVCRKCHSTGFYRTGFVERWREEKLTGFFNWMSNMMPRDSPGTRSQNEYLDIAAYIMSNNDVPAGSQELTIDAVTTIQVQRKDGPAPLPDGTLVRVVGCLTQEADKSWRLTKANAPAHTRMRDASTELELKVSQGQTFGTNTFALAYINAFMPDSHKGHKVEAKGDLDRSNGERIMLSSLQTLAPSCE